MKLDSTSETSGTTKRYSITLDDGRKATYIEYLDDRGKVIDEELWIINGDQEDPCLDADILVQVQKFVDEQEKA